MFLSLHEIVLLQQTVLQAFVMGLFMSFNPLSESVDTWLVLSHLGHNPDWHLNWRRSLVLAQELDGKPEPAYEGWIWPLCQLEKLSLF